MFIVSVDSRGRIVLPKKMGFKAKKGIIIPRDGSYLLIPIPEKVIEIDVPQTMKKLKLRIDEKAKHELKGLKKDCWTM